MHALIPSTPAVAAHRPYVLDDDIPAPRRRRRFFTHAAIGGARRLSGFFVLGSIGSAGLMLAHGGLVSSLLGLAVCALPCAGAVGATSVMLGARRRRLRAEAQTLRLAAEERLCEGDFVLESVRDLEIETMRPLSPGEMQEVEARIDYFADLVRARLALPSTEPSEPPCAQPSSSSRSTFALRSPSSSSTAAGSP